MGADVAKHSQVSNLKNVLKKYSCNDDWLKCSTALSCEWYVPFWTQSLQICFIPNELCVIQIFLLQICLADGVRWLSRASILGRTKWCCVLGQGISHYFSQEECPCTYCKSPWIRAPANRLNINDGHTWVHMLRFVACCKLINSSQSWHHQRSSVLRPIPTDLSRLGLVVGNAS